MQPLWKTVWGLLKKLKTELPYDLTIPFLGTYPEKTKILIWKVHALQCSPLHHLKQPRHGSNLNVHWQKNKEYVVYIYNGILLSHKKEWNNDICSKRDGPRNYHTKWSKSKREKQIPHNTTHMWNLKYDTNLFSKQNQTHRHRKQT